MIERKDSVEVLVLTVTDIETEEFNKQLQIAGYVGRQVFHAINSYWVYGPVGGARFALVRSSMGAGGQSGSALTIGDAISDLNPSAVIALGIAFGMGDEMSQPIGTVLISESVTDYELEKVGTNSVGGRIEIRRGGERVPASARLLSRFRNANLQDHGFKVRFGEILSGDKLIDNTDFKLALGGKFPNAIGGEMEIVGVQAACGRSQTDWIMVKAVCDYAERKSQDKDERQRIAASAASSAFLRVLESGAFAVQ
jgi:nucleoside phosphorylase